MALTLEAWRFRDPALIVEQMQAAKRREAARDKVLAEQTRRNKARRIRQLVKKAKS